MVGFAFTPNRSIVGFLHRCHFRYPFGGLLFVAGSFIMVYNVWRTIKGDIREGEPLDASLATPAVAAAK